MADYLMAGIARVCRGAWYGQGEGKGGNAEAGICPEECPEFSSSNKNEVSGKRMRNPVPDTS
jgi:hypothetical protein